MEQQKVIDEIEFSLFKANHCIFEELSRMQWLFILGNPLKSYTIVSLKYLIKVTLVAVAQKCGNILQRDDN